MRFQTIAFMLFGALWALVIISCGQEPSFVEGLDQASRKSSESKSDDPAKSTDSTSADAVGEVAEAQEEEIQVPEENSSEDKEVAEDPVGDPPTSPAMDSEEIAEENTSEVVPLPDVPGAADEDLAALHKCMENWGELPFGDTVTNYRVIHGSFTYGGYGVPINDQVRTSAPELILIRAGINIKGSAEYNLLNPMGYYCMKLNVNIDQDLTINVHCNARLSDSKLNVNVDSQQNDTISEFGVHVESDVKVVTVRPAGDPCIR